jgi:hypothetical protein
MMNAGVFLILAMHKVTTAAKRTVAARAAKKSNTYPLTDGPTLDPGTQLVDSPNGLMARDARPIDRKQAFHCARIRVTDSARLDADAHLAGSRSLQCLLRQLEAPWADRLDCAIG